MQMTTILVTPEQLEAVSRQFEQARQEIARMNGELTLQVLMMEALWDGTTKQRFYSDFVMARSNMATAVELTSSISRELRNHAEKFRLADEAMSGGLDPACIAPPPNACAAPTVDTRNTLEKSGDSLKELGTNFMAAANERYEKRYDSVGGFLDYWTFGIPKGMWQGYADRADKWLDSPEDFANWATLGVHGTIRETVFPQNAWSTEHWANILGTAGLVGGGTIASTIKPKNYFGASAKSVVERTDDVSRNIVDTKGLRNDLPLTQEQIDGLVSYAKKLGFPEDKIHVADTVNTSNTSMMYDEILIINNDVLPSNMPTKNPNSLISGKGTIAHEIIGHYETALKNTAFAQYDFIDNVPVKNPINYALDEAQASIRAARFAPELSQAERIMLIRDGIQRLRNANLKLKDVKHLLDIIER
jgi:WXG100 family type VII secretion target